jgi:hypothetical protein
MRRFSGKLVLVLLDDRDHPSIRDGRSLWALQRELIYTTVVGDTITVPAGFVTDLASIPRIVGGILPPDGPWTEAAVIHDCLYFTMGGVNLWHGRRCISRAKPYSRSEADGILREAMADIGVGLAQRNIIWSGVRVGGARGWSH